MDSLTEIEKEIEKQTEEPQKVVLEDTGNVQKEEKTSTEQPLKEDTFSYANTSYLSSFENKTVADYMKENEQELQAEADNLREKIVNDAAEKEKDFLAKQHEYAREVFERERQQKNTKTEQQEALVKEPPVTNEEKSENIIEKPNYDLIEENKKIVKLTKKPQKQRKKGKKVASIALAISLAVSGIVCVTNCVLVDQYQSSYIEIEDTYNMNLYKYLKNISNLDATKKSMDVIETYPEEELSAGDLGQSSNWFDKICEFLAGLFGG